MPDEAICRAQRLVKHLYPNPTQHLKLFKKVLVANRGEIAIRVFRACRELGIATVAVHVPSESHALHVVSADETHCLHNEAGYLDAEQILAAVVATGADAVHPGYGFLSEDAQFAEKCRLRNVSFIGPDPEAIQLFGDKTKAKAFVAPLGLPLLRGPTQPCQSPDAVRESMTALSIPFPIMLKAVGGGGGKGLRVIRSDDELNSAFKRCQSEVSGSVDIPGVFFEELMEQCRSPTPSML